MGDRVHRRLRQGRAHLGRPRSEWTATIFKGVCAVAGLAGRGLDASAGVLFVVDGGKAIDKAIRAVYGDNAKIQRCRRRKERNVPDHLPETERQLVQRKLRAAWASPDPSRPKPT